MLAQHLTRLSHEASRLAVQAEASLAATPELPELRPHLRRLRRTARALRRIATKAELHAYRDFARRARERL